MAQQKPFYIYAANRSGHRKGQRLLGVATSEEKSLQDLIDFLASKGIKPAQVILPGHFVTHTRKGNS